MDESAQTFENYVHVMSLIRQAKDQIDRALDQLEESPPTNSGVLYASAQLDGASGGLDYASDILTEIHRVRMQKHADHLRRVLSVRGVDVPADPAPVNPFDGKQPKGKQQ